MSANPPHAVWRVPGIHTGPSGPDQPEVTMWNSECREPGPTVPTSLEAERSALHPEPHLQKENLQAIASILAVGRAPPESPKGRGFGGHWEKGEESLNISGRRTCFPVRTRAFMSNKRVQQVHEGVARESSPERDRQRATTDRGFAIPSCGSWRSSRP